MARKFLLGTLVLSLTAFVNGCGLSSNQPSDPQSEVPSQQEAANESKSEEVSNKITVSENSVWSQQECDEAIKLAEVVIEAVKNNDLNALSKTINYPITISSSRSNEELQINNEAEFLNLSFDEVFTDEMCSRIINTQELFASWRGFMLGRGEIWVSPVDAQMQVISINKI